MEFEEWKVTSNGFVPTQWNNGRGAASGNEMNFTILRLSDVLCHVYII